MAVSISKTQDGVSHKIDKKTGNYICLECKQLMRIFKVVDGRLVCLNCAVRLAGNKGQGIKEV